MPTSLGMAVLTLTLLAGCTDLSAPTGASDPPSFAPELEGSWLLQAAGNELGCWELDSTGDPVTLSHNPILAQYLGLDELDFTGTPGKITFQGLEATYTATAMSATSGSLVTIEATINVSVVIQVATIDLLFNGTLNGDTITGTLSTTVSVESLAPEISQDEATGTRGACD